MLSQSNTKYNTNQILQSIAYIDQAEKNKYLATEGDDSGDKQLSKSSINK